MGIKLEDMTGVSPIAIPSLALLTPVAQELLKAKDVAAPAFLADENTTNGHLLCEAKWAQILEQTCGLNPSQSSWHFTYSNLLEHFNTAWPNLRDHIEQHRRIIRLPAWNPDHTDKVNDLVVASYIPSYDVINCCLSQGTKLWEWSRLYGYALTAVALYYPNTAMPWLLAGLPASLNPRNPDYDKILLMAHDSIITTIICKQTHAATALLNWYSNHNYHITKSMFNEWLDYAIKSNDAAVVQATLRVNIEKRLVHVNWNHFLLSLEHGNIHVVRVLLDHFDYRKDYHGQTPLFEAKRYGRDDVFQEIFMRTRDPTSSELPDFQSPGFQN